MSDGSYKDIGQFHKESITQEIFVDKCYEKFFEVEEGDVVLDIGASVGPFTYSILNKKPKHVFCFEPSESEFTTLVNNTLGYPVTHINKGISNVNSVVMNDHLFGGEDQMESITFKKFIDLYGIEKIDFLKTDCEGGEFHIFTDENFDWIKSNVRKIVGEWHIQLQGHNYVEEFREFRDKYLSKFENFQIYSVDNVDIKWDLWNDHFLEYYKQIIIHIDNR
jgi:FkbM family methyltransferase